MGIHSLTDDRNYNAQVNCVINFDNGDMVVAGEDGLIKITYKYDKHGKENEKESKKKKETYLEKMLDSDGYLANIEGVKILNNKDIICIETLGNIGVYEKENNYKLKIIQGRITNDCFYYINIISENEVEIFGETGKKYNIYIKQK